jgi:hypothetical protein
MKTVRYVVSEELVEWDEIEAKLSIPFSMWPTAALEEQMYYIYGLDAYLPDGLAHDDELWQRLEAVEWVLTQRYIAATSSEGLQEGISFLSQQGYSGLEIDANGHNHAELAARRVLCIIDVVPF